MFQTEEYFKSYPAKISNVLIKDIKIFCEEILTSLSKHDIHKFTVVLDSFEQINIIINNDNDRTIVESLTVNTVFGKAKVDITSIQNVNYSSIPLVYVSGNKKYQQIVSKIKDIFYKLLPKNYKLRNGNGSLYIIVSNDIIGQLWNIHSDPLIAKAHLILTDCEEYFVWYPKDKDKVIEKVSVKNFYLFNVSINHTVFIKTYFDNLRIHIVGDLDYDKE